MNLKFICLSLVLFFFSYSVFAQVDIKLNNNKTEFSVLEKNHFKVKAKISVDKIRTFSVSTVEGFFNEITINGFSKTFDAGKPDLPVVTRLIEIPYDAEIQINIISYDEQNISLNDLKNAYKIIPAQPSVSKGDDPTKLPFHYDKVLYQTNAFTETEMITVTSAGDLRGVLTGHLTVSPFRYNPVTNILKVYNNLVFEVIFKHPDLEKTEQMKARFFSPAFENTMGTLINYRSPQAKDEISKYPIKYVIISPSSFQASLQPFVYWKRQKGFTVIEQYYSTTPTTATIKTYLQNLYNAGTPADPAPTYVLFVGDVAQIPSNSGTTGTHVTDLYYCTFGGTSDYIPDMYYGRFSATSTAHVDVQVGKTLQYEKYNMPKKTYLDTVVMVAGVDASYGPTHANGQINYGTANYFNAAHGMYSYTHLYPNSGNEDAIIRTEIGKGVGFANYTAHCGSDGWGDPEFTSTQVSSMVNANKYGLLIGNCCLSNKFDDTQCFGETMLRTANKGAVGYIGASNNSLWNEDFYWSVGLRTTINANPTYDATKLGAYDCVFHDHGELKTKWFITNGQIIHAGNLAVEASSSSQKKYYWEIYHIMGDPSVMTYFSVPDPLTVNYTNPQTTGVSSLVVNTEEDAYVAISHNGVLYDAELAPAGGVVTLSFSPINQADTLDVVVTKQNKQPYIGNLIVLAPSIPLDAELFNIITPEANYNCTGINLTPQITLRNNGINTITTCKITYQVGSGTPQVFNWAGSLSTGQSTPVNLDPFVITPGSFTFTAFTSLPNNSTDQNPSNDSKSKDFTASQLSISSDFSAATLDFCTAPAVVNFSNTSTNASTYLWDFGDGSTSTDMNPAHTYSTLGSFNVKLTAYAGICGNDIEIKNNYITVGAAMPIGNDNSRCGPGSLTLTANATGTINWYDAPTAGNLVNTGAVFVTPVLSATTTYYVRNVIDGGTAYTGKTANNTTYGSNYNSNSVHGLYFTANQPFVLKSAKIYAQGAGFRKFKILNAAGLAIDSMSVNCPDGENRVTFNWNIPAGTNLRIVGPATPNLWRDGSTSTSAPTLPYPYVLPNVVSITKSTATNGNELKYYYFLFDWEVELQDCVSGNTLVKAIIFNNPADALFSQNVNGLNVSFINNSVFAATYFWNFGDGNTSTDVNPTHTYASPGTYQVMLIATNDCNSDTIYNNISVNVTSIEQNESFNVSIFPNPVKSEIEINLNNNKADKIVLTDLLGQEILVLNQIDEKIRLDMSSFKTGVYFIRFYSEDKVYNYKITKI